MVVIGTSSSGLLQSQEVSVVGFDADYLEALGASDLSDIAQFTPNLEIRTPFAASNPTLFIRGVGLRDFNANSSSSVAVYNDNIYMNSPAGQLAQLFDVEAVDVLRGPQGGVYGRNASAGAIRVLSRKPTGTAGGYVNTTYGRFQQIEVEAAAEAPIVPDMLSMRISGRMNRRGGTTKNRCGDPNFATDPTPTGGGALGARPFESEVHRGCFNTNTTGNPRFLGLGWQVGQRAPVKERVNDVNNWAMRAIVRLQLDLLDGVDILFNVHGGQNRGDARQFQHVGAEQGVRDPLPLIRDGNLDDQQDISQYLDPDNFYVLLGSGQEIRDPYIGRAFEGDYNNVEKEQLDLFGANIDGDVTIGNWTIKGVVGYEQNARDTTIDLDGSPYPGLEPNLTNSAWQATGELRIAWDGGDGLSFQVAGMFLHEALEVDNEFSLLTGFDVRRQQYSFWTRYGSVYGETTWEPTEWLSIKGSVRFNSEKKKINLFGSAGPDDRVNFGNRPPEIFTEKSKGDEIGWAGDLTISYLPTSDVTLYAKYARGWKGPHINGLVISQAAPNDGGGLAEPVAPEIVDSIELGWKTVWWESRIRFNGALFYYDYQDLQVFRLRNSGSVPSNELINANDAGVLGVEFDIDVRPFEGIGPPILGGIHLFTSFAWLETSYTDFVNIQRTTTATGPGTTITRVLREDFSGAQLVNAPKFSFVGFAQWVLPTDYGTVTPRFDWSFKDDVFFSPANIELVGQSALWLMNFRLTYKAPSENIEISGWVENLTDQVYTVDVFNLARFREAILYAIGDPRTYGVSVKVTF